jgi:hypothetical protein
MCPFEFVEGIANVINSGRRYVRQIRLNIKALALAGRVYFVTRSIRAQKARIETEHAKVGL